MSEVCPDVATEPTLQPVSNEQFFHRSANTECGARLDVRAQGFWGVCHQQAYFDVYYLTHWQTQIAILLLPAVFSLTIEKSE